MEQARWSFIDRLLDKLAHEHSDGLPQEVSSIIAEHLEEVLSTSSRAELGGVSSQLANLFKRLLKKAPRPVADAVRGVGGDNVAKWSYSLGQISFAQLLAAYATDRRADDNFVQTLKDDSFSEYIRALATKDMIGLELANFVKERAETVSRKLKRLRELGITDFRREGTSTINFLTPAAKAVLHDRPSLQKKETTTRVVACTQMEKLLDRRHIPRHMRHSQNFGATPTSTKWLGQTNV